MNFLKPDMLDQELRDASDHWGLLAATGILLIVCGFFAMLSPAIASTTSIFMLGFLMIVGGLAAIIGGIRHRSSGGLAFYLVTGILAMIAGILIVKEPITSQITLTWLIALWLLVSGIFRFVSAFFHKEGRGWLLFGGGVSALLGLMLLGSPLASSIWFIGFAVGIEMIFAGWAWLALGMAAKSMRDQPPVAPAV